MTYTQGQPERARIALAAALAAPPGVIDATTIAHAEVLLGHIERTAGNEAAARALFTRSDEAFRKLRMPWGIGNALIGLASIALTAGAADQAENLLDEAAAVLRDAGPWFLNLPLYIHAILAVQRGHADAAIDFVRESLVCSRQLQDKFAFIYALIPLAAAASLKHDDAWAARILGARDAITERIGATLTDVSTRGLREEAERQGQSRLGSDRWARAYAAGRTASLDSLLKDIEAAAT